MEFPLAKIMEGYGDLFRERQLRLYGELSEAFQKNEFRVVVFGEFSRGKSTLINALLGRVVLPAKLIPTTGHITRILYGKHEEVRVHLTNGQIACAPLEALDSLAVLDRDGSARGDIDYLEVIIDSPFLSNGIVLVDTPGVMDKDAQTARAKRAIAAADLVLVLLDATQLLTSAERKFVEDWLFKSLKKPVIPVVNFLNRVDEAEVPQVRGVLQAWSDKAQIKEFGKAWFEINALGALAHNVKGTAAPRDDYFVFRSQLFGMTGTQQERLKTRARSGQLRAEVELSITANNDIIARLETDSGEVRRQRLADYEKLNDELRRLRQKAPACIRQLLSEGAAFMNQRLKALLDTWYAGESLESLQSNASRWFTDRLLEGTENIEKRGNEILRQLAVGISLKPEPLTIRERTILNARIDIGTLETIGPSEGTVNGAMVAGGVIGQVLIPIPVVGTAIGATAGTFLAHFFGSSQPDHKERFCEATKPKWEEMSGQVLRTAERQANDRIRLLVEHLKAEITHQLNAAQISESSVWKLAQTIAAKRQVSCDDNILREVERQLLGESCNSAAAAKELKRRKELKLELESTHVFLGKFIKGT